MTLVFPIIGCQLLFDAVPQISKGISVSLLGKTELSSKLLQNCTRHFACIRCFQVVRQDLMSLFCVLFSCLLILHRQREQQVQAINHSLRLAQSAKGSVNS